MKRNISQITSQIDNLANRGCRLMNKKEKEEFFQTTKMKRYYIKGKNKGKERDLYCIDGQCFNQIWKLTYPYVFTSCSKSVYYNSLELEEAIAEVRFTLFSVLQRFGPVMDGKSLSQRLSIIVNIGLTNNNRKLIRQPRTISIDNFEKDENFEMNFEDPDSNMKDIDFNCDIPNSLKEPIMNVILGKSNIKDNEVKKKVSVFIENYLK